MKRKLSFFLLCIFLLTFFSHHIASAAPLQNEPSYFSFLKNYLIAFTVIDSYNKQVLALHTKAKSPTVDTSIPAYLLQGVNAYRASLGLSPVQSSTQTCSFAAIRAKEIVSNFSHDGFNNRVNNHSIPYFSWSRVTENLAEAPSFKEVVTLWENSPGHAANMRDNTPYVCIEQYGNYYVYEGMRP